MLPLKELTGDKIAGFLVPFCDKALKLKNSIEKGEIPLVVIPEPGSSPIPQGFFGLKP